MRLLLVDDDEGLRTLVRSTLDEIDFDVAEAGSAADARAAVAERVPDVIVLDVWMPGESGISSAASSSRRRRPPARGSSYRLARPRAAPNGGGRRRSGAVQPAGSRDRHACSRDPFARGRRRGRGRPTAPHVRARPAPALPAGVAAALEEAYRDTARALAERLASKDAGTIDTRGASALRARAHRCRRCTRGRIRASVASCSDSARSRPDPAQASPLDGARRDAAPRRHRRRCCGVSLLRGRIAVVRSHHEPLGRRRPGRSRGTSDPLAARLFAVADCARRDDHRPCVPARCVGRRRRRIRKRAGTQFDPRVVEAFEARRPSCGRSAARSGPPDQTADAAGRARRARSRSASRAAVKTSPPSP